MTRAELAALTARTKRLERIMRAIHGIYSSYYDGELRAAEAELKAALDSVPTEPVAKLGY